MTHSTDAQTIFTSLGLTPPADCPAGLAVRTPIDGSLLARVAVSTDAQTSASIARAPTAAF